MTDEASASRTGPIRSEPVQSESRLNLGAATGDWFVEADLSRDAVGFEPMGTWRRPFIFAKPVSSLQLSPRCVTVPPHGWS